MGAPKMRTLLVAALALCLCAVVASREFGCICARRGDGGALLRLALWASSPLPASCSSQLPASADR